MGLAGSDSTPRPHLFILTVCTTSESFNSEFEGTSVKDACDSKDAGWVMSEVTIWLQNLSDLSTKYEIYETA